MTQGAAHGIGCIECQRQHTTVAALVDKTGMVRLLVAQSVEIVLKKNMICGRDYLSQVDLDCVRVEAARLKVVGARQSVYGRRVQAVRARKYIRGAGEIVQIKVAERGQQQNSREHFDRVAARDERQAMDAFADHRSREGMSRHHLDVRDEMEKKKRECVWRLLYNCVEQLYEEQKRTLSSVSVQGRIFQLFVPIYTFKAGGKLTDGVEREHGD